MSASESIALEVPAELAKDAAILLKRLVRCSQSQRLRGAGRALLLEIGIVFSSPEGPRPKRWAIEMADLEKLATDRGLDEEFTMGGLELRTAIGIAFEELLGVSAATSVACGPGLLVGLTGLRSISPPVYNFEFQEREVSR